MTLCNKCGRSFHWVDDEAGRESHIDYIVHDFAGQTISTIFIEARYDGERIMAAHQTLPRNWIVI